MDDNPHGEPPTHSGNTVVLSSKNPAAGMENSVRRPKRSYGRVIALAVLAIAGFGGWRVYQRVTISTAQKSRDAIAVESRLPVQVVRAKTGLVQEWVFDEGAALPVELAVLTFEASGEVTYLADVDGVPLREGDLVVQGQRLATIDERKQTASIQTAQADVQVAVSQRNQAEAAFFQTQATLEKAESDLALAQTDFQRNQRLFKEGALSASSRDLSQNQVDQAQAGLKAAQQDVRSAQEGMRSADAAIAAAQAQFNQTAITLEDTQLISPIDGIVAYINIQKGDYWNTQFLNSSSAQKVIETAPIVVVDPQSFEVELEIQTDEAGAIRPGQSAYVVLEEAVTQAQTAGAKRQTLLDIAKQRGSLGTVFAVSPSQSPEGRGTKVTLRNFQQVRNLKVNARVYVWIEVASEQNAVVLPLGALLLREGQFYAFVVNETDRTVQRRAITQGIRGLSEVGVLSGVKPGELVVVEGQNRLVEGTPVEIVNLERVNQEPVQ